MKSRLVEIACDVVLVEMRSVLDAEAPMVELVAGNLKFILL